MVISGPETLTKPPNLKPTKPSVPFEASTTPRCQADPITDYTSLPCAVRNMFCFVDFKVHSSQLLVYSSPISRTLNPRVSIFTEAPEYFQRISGVRPTPENSWSV